MELVCWSFSLSHVKWRLVSSKVRQHRLFSDKFEITSAKVLKLQKLEFVLVQIELVEFELILETTKDRVFLEGVFAEKRHGLLSNLFGHFRDFKFFKFLKF